MERRKQYRKPTDRERAISVYLHATTAGRNALDAFECNPGPGWLCRDDRDRFAKLVRQMGEHLDVLFGQEVNETLQRFEAGER